jgi:predicted lipid-binding transport protein (Tim44 family)
MKILLALALALSAVTLMVPSDADARRFGGGLSLGKQYRSMPRTSPRQSQPASPAGGSTRTGAFGGSRWLGPLAGLAAGGLLASLFFGDSFQGLQILDILLIGGLLIGGLMLFRAMRRRGPVATGAGSGGYGAPASGGRIPVPQMMPPALGGATTTTAATGGDEAPVWFDSPGFVEGAKTHFIRLQAAWDQADFRDIREYTTPELFAELKRERDRLGEDAQYTEVVTLNAEIVGIQRDGDQVVASILFSGLIREEQSAAADPFREIWHVRHDWDSGEGDWLVAGVQQAQDDSAQTD